MSLYLDLVEPSLLQTFATLHQHRPPGNHAVFLSLSKISTKFDLARDALWVLEAQQIAIKRRVALKALEIVASAAQTSQLAMG